MICGSSCSLRLGICGCEHGRVGECPTVVLLSANHNNVVQEHLDNLANPALTLCLSVLIRK